MLGLPRGFCALLVMMLDPSPAVAQSFPPSPPLPVETTEAPAATHGDPRAAATLLESGLAVDSLSYEINWRAAMAVIDVGKQLDPQGRGRREQDSLYRVAVRYSRRAVRLAPGRPEGHFALAASLGRAGQTRDIRERLEHADEILSEAKQAIALEEALRLAVTLRPNWIFHRLDLAEALIDAGRLEAGRGELRAIESLREIDIQDREYETRAKALLRRIGEGGGR
jgi:hypothetical protein